MHMLKNVGRSRAGDPEPISSHEAWTIRCDLICSYKSERFGFDSHPHHALGFLPGIPFFSPNLIQFNFIACAVG